MSPSVLSHVTLWHFCICDFAEIFVYLSGFIGIGSYERALDAGDTRGVFKTLVRRMRRLYIAHVLSMTATMMLCAVAWLRRPNSQPRLASLPVVSEAAAGE